ncbi:MAG: hypothetical protein LBF68_05435 [Christensenellaceae bacterium]|jgi:hypothetical protein|nr:hypothetical protein [Christensenellaceae bacterium]
MEALKKEKRKHLIKMLVPICAAVSLVVIAAIAMSGLYGWFAFSDNAVVSESTFFVRTGNEPNIQIEALDVNGNLLENPPTVIKPGDYLRFRISLYNHTGTTVKRSLLINNLFVLYPTQKTIDSVPFTFDNEHVNTDDYYFGTGMVRFDIFNTTNFPNQSNRYDFFTSFMAPATNALRYSLRTTFNPYFDPNENYLKMTALSNATASEIIAPEMNNVLATPVPLSISSIENITAFSIPSTATTYDTAVVTYLLLYFNPDFPSTSLFSNQPVVLKNSNPFYWQDLEIFLNFEDVSV